MAEKGKGKEAKRGKEKEKTKDKWWESLSVTLIECHYCHKKGHIERDYGVKAVARKKGSVAAVHETGASTTDASNSTGGGGASTTDASNSTGGGRGAGGHVRTAQAHQNEVSWRMGGSVLSKAIKHGVGNGLELLMLDGGSDEHCCMPSLDPLSLHSLRKLVSATLKEGAFH
eukprot:3917609-Amphidinium_carterae.3